MTVEAVTNEPELEQRLNCLVYEIQELERASINISNALERLGTSNLPKEADQGKTSKEPDNFLERFDKEINHFSEIRKALEDSAERLKITV